MDNVLIRPSGSLGRNFIPEKYLPTGKDEFYLRDKQVGADMRHWRHLRADEVEELVKNGNKAENWDDLLVSEEFDARQIKNCEFFGLVRVGRLRDVVLEHHDLKLRTGMSNSFIVSCDIGDDVAIHDVRYLAHYIIGDRCILTNIDEMHTTNYAKFGNGILKDGEKEEVRVWLDLINESGCRKILPFDGMIPADAYLWAKYRDYKAMLKKFKELTQKQHDSRRGYYGTVGDQCVIKNSRILKDVKIGRHCYIKGANKLKNLTINSSEDEPSQIGEGVELVNGIMGFGCHIFYGCKAVRFILGNNSSLKYGARLIHSFLGDNSTISCCEVLNNLIFPAHEQHHNNSFLIASLTMGQSNMAAGATIGSNHNSRANDNEIQAGRGFWPGLCTSIKHSCRFASFVLLSKGDYPFELDIPLPFSLLNNNCSKNTLDVIPAFWWLYNMYALARNTWKFQNRDKRINKIQQVEFDCLAPDTIEEIFKARRLLEIWTGKAEFSRTGQVKELSEEKAADIGKKLLTGPAEPVKDLEILGENMEKSYRKVVISKVHQAYNAYEQMIRYYAVKNLMAYMDEHPESNFAQMQKTLDGPRQIKWVNLGGQLILESDVDQIRAEIGSGLLDSWEAIHKRYQQIWQGYGLQKQRHAFACLTKICGANGISRQRWLKALDEAVEIQEYIRDQVYISRQKDFENPFRQATFRNAEEMLAAIGTVEDNDFVKRLKADTEKFRKQAAKIAKRS